MIIPLDIAHVNMFLLIICGCTLHGRYTIYGISSANILSLYISVLAHELACEAEVFLLFCVWIVSGDFVFS